MHANLNLVLIEPVADVAHKLPARIYHLWHLQLNRRDKILLEPKMRYQSRELSVEGFVEQLDVRGLDHNFKLMSAAPDANETGIYNVLEMHCNA